MSQQPHATGQDPEKSDSIHLECKQAGFDGAGHPDPRLERRFVHKLDRTILPFIMIMYLLSYMDRSNMGNVRKIGLEEDLGLSSNQYAWASASFYFGTIIFGTIGGLMLKIVKPSTWLACCMIGWGAMGTLQAVVHNAQGLIAVRFFLGVFEASFAPGCALYMSFWYLKSELSLRIAAYAGMSTISGIISGLVAYGFGEAGSNLVIQAWKAVFLVEGLPTIAFGLLTFWVLPDRPEAGKSHWFTEEEQAIAVSRRTRHAKQADDGINWKHVGRAFLDPRLYLFTVIYSGLSLSLAVLSVFLPTIVATMGYSGVKANLMTAPVYAAAYVALIINAWGSDRMARRGLPIIAGGALSGTGYLLLATVQHNQARYAFTFMVAMGTYMAFPLVLAWISSTFASDTKSGVGIGIVIAVTHAVGVAASHIYPDSDAPRYVMGNAVSSSLGFSTAVGSVIMMLLLFRENRQRDRRHGKPEEGAVVYVGAEADKNPNFRYML